MESRGDARHLHTREPRLGVARPMDRTRDAYQAGFLPAGKFVNGPWGVPQPGRIHPPSDVSPSHPPRPVHHSPGHASPLPRKCEGASSNESRRRDVGRSTLYRKILIEGSKRPWIEWLRAVIARKEFPSFPSPLAQFNFGKLRPPFLGD